jgi:hypothetical protein
VTWDIGSANCDRHLKATASEQGLSHPWQGKSVPSSSKTNDWRLVCQGSKSRANYTLSSRERQIILAAGTFRTGLEAALGQNKGRFDFNSRLFRRRRIDYVHYFRVEKFNRLPN